MENLNPHGEPGARLKYLLRAAGLKSLRVDRTRRSVAFTGRTRDWSVVVGLDREWLHVYTYVCDLPKETMLRARLFEETMRINQRMRLAKFVAADGLYLELDYRAEHLDACVLGRLVTHVHANAEEHFPKVFRIVSGDEALDALEAALAGGGGKTGA